MTGLSTPEMLPWLALIPGLLLVGGLYWMTKLACSLGNAKMDVAAELSGGCNHHITLHPFDIKAEGLVCKGCGLEMDLPRGAPRDPVERLRWARLHGLLPWQHGVSVAFLEALRAI